MATIKIIYLNNRPETHVFREGSCDIQVALQSHLKAINLDRILRTKFPKVDYDDCDESLVEEIHKELNDFCSSVYVINHTQVGEEEWVATIQKAAHSYWFKGYEKRDS